MPQGLGWRPIEGNDGRARPRGGDGEAARRAGLRRKGYWGVVRIEVARYTMLDTIPTAWVHLIALFPRQIGIRTSLGQSRTLIFLFLHL